MVQKHQHNAGQGQTLLMSGGGGGGVIIPREDEKPYNIMIYKQQKEHVCGVMTPMEEFRRDLRILK